MPIVSFDFHAQCKASRNDGLRHLVRALEPTLGAHAFTSASPCDGGAAPVVRRKQGGVLRTNCLDCLNRTNMAQAALALHAATAQIADSGVIVDGTASSEAQSALRRLWAETGDALSLQYTGTANLSRGTGIAEGDAKKSLMEKGFGLVEKGVRTVNRYVQEQLFDDAASRRSIACSAAAAARRPLASRVGRPIPPRRERRRRRLPAALALHRHVQRQRQV